MQNVTIDSGSGLCHATQLMVPSHHVHIILSTEWEMKFCQPSFITILVYPFFKWFESSFQIDLIHKSHNIPVLYPTMHNAEQKCAHFYSKWCIVGYGIGALWDLWDCSINLISFIISQLQCEVSNASGKNTWIELFMQNDFTMVLHIFTADIEYQFSRGHDTQFWHLMCHCHLGPFRTCTKSSTNTPRLIYWKQ